MAVTFRIENNFANSGSKLRSIARRAEVRALNAAIRSARTEVSRFITEQAPLKAKDIKKRLFERTAKTRNAAAPAAALNVKVDFVPLFWFGARSKKVKTSAGPRTGATAVIRGARQIVPGGFVATMPNGKEALFSRKSNSRLPIKQLFSTEVKTLLDSNPAFLAGVEARAREAARKGFDEQFKFLSSR